MHARLPRFIALVLAFACAQAADRTFTGPNNGNWSVAANWSGGAVPVTGDNVAIPTGITVVLDTSPSPLGTVTIAGGLVISSSRTLTATSIVNNGLLRLNGGGIANSAISGNAPVMTTTGGNMLDNVTLDADLDIFSISGASATVKNALTLANGRTIRIGAADGSTYGYLAFTGSGAKVVTTGTASIAFGGSASNQIYDTAASTTVEIGSGIAITGGMGRIYATNTGSLVKILGSIDAATAGKTITLGYSSAYPVSISGTVGASAGILDIVGAWTNTGTLAVAGTGTITLGGAFTASDAAAPRWSRSGGTVVISGKLTIADSLDITAAMGEWRLGGADISGGALRSTGGTLVGLATASTLRNLILDADLDLSQFSGATANITGTVNVADGRSILVGNASGTTYGYLRFTPDGSGASTLNAQGKATLRLGDSASNLIYDQANSTQLTIGAGITVEGGAGTIYATYTGSATIIDGAVRALTTGKTINLGYSATYPLSLGGSVSAEAGTISLRGAWTNTGTLAVSGSGALVLDGAFAEASVAAARWNRTGGTVSIAGALSIAESLDLTAGMGAWRLAGGSITGGTLTSSGGVLIATGAGGTLRNLVLDADLDMAQVNGAQATINGSVVLSSGHKISIGAADGTTYGYLNFSGDANRVAMVDGGTGATIVFGGSSSNLIRDVSSNTDLCIASGITLTGGAGTLYATYSGSTATIDGAVNATTAGKTIILGYSTGYPLAINGTISAGPGNVRIEGTWTNTGTLAPSGSGTLTLDGTFTDASVAAARWNRTGGAVVIAGNLTISSLLELTAGMGAWRLSTGAIAGGTLRSTGGSLVATSGGGILKDIVLDADLDMTQASGASATISGSVTLGDGRTVSIGAADGTTYAYLNFDGGANRIATLATAGASTVRFGGSASNLIRDTNSNTDLRIDAGIAVIGGAGTIYATYTGSTLNIAGDVLAQESGKTISLGYSTTYPLAIAGTVSAAGGNVAINGLWTNTGTLAASGTGTLTLDGSFGEGSVDAARWNRSGGTVVIAGLLTIGGSLDLTAAMGEWRLQSAGIAGGTLRSTGGTLVGTASVSTFRDIALDADLDLSLVNGAQAVITGVVTLGDGREIRVGSADGTRYGYLNFLGNASRTATLASSGASRIVLGGSTSNTIRDYGSNTDMQLTSGITVTGGAGYLYGSYTGSQTMILGAIRATESGKTIQIGYSAIPTSLSGTLEASAGTILVQGAWSNSGTFSVSGTGTIHLDGSFSETSVAAARWNRAGGTVIIAGDLAIGGTLELTAAMGAWLLQGANITGGTIRSTGGTLVGTGASSRFRNIVLDADLDLSGQSGASAIVQGAVALGDGRAIRIGAADGSTYGYLFFAGDAGVATLSTPGAASVLLGKSQSNSIYDYTAGTRMRFAAGIQVVGGGGWLYSSSNTGSDLTIDGSVAAATPGATFFLGYGSASMALNGTAAATGGELVLDGNWTNTGTLRTTAGSLALAGAFSPASVAGPRWQRSGGSVELRGTVQLDGGTVALDAATGDWEVTSASFVGGTISDPGGRLKFASAYANFDATVIESGTTIDLAAASGSQLAIVNGMRVDGRILVGNTAGTTYAYLTFTGNQTIDGSGDIVLGASTSNALIANNANAVVTLAAPLTVRGQAGYFQSYYTGSGFINQGTIRSESSGQGFDLYCDAFTNSGTIVVGDERRQSWTIYGNFTQTAAGLLVIGADSADADLITLSGASSTIQLDGTLRIISEQGFVPDGSYAKTIIDAAGGTISGSFAGVQGSYSLAYSGSSVGIVGAAGASAPTVALTSTAPDPTTLNPIPVAVLFSEPVQGFTLADIVSTNATAANLAGSGAAYTYDLIPTIGQSAVSTRVAAGAAYGAAFMSNAASNELSRQYGGRILTISAIAPSSGPVSGGTTLTITANGLIPAGATSVSIGGATAAVIGVDAASVTCVTPAGTAGATDLTLINDGLSATAVGGFTYLSNDPPVIAGIVPGGGLRAGGTLVAIDGSGFATVSAVSFGGVTASALTVIDDATLTCVLPPMPVQIPDGYVDVAVTASTGTTIAAGAFYIRGPIAATVAAGSATASAAPVEFSVAFDAPVSAISLAGITLVNGTVASVAPDANQVSNRPRESGPSALWRILVDPEGDGAVRLGLLAGAATDVHGIPTEASNIAETIFDGGPPVPALSVSSGPTNASPIVFTATWSEPVSWTDLIQVVATNGAIGAITGDGSTFSIPVTPASDGVVSLTIGPGAAADGASNANTASATAETTYDGTAPLISIAAPAGPAATAPIVFLLTASEPVALDVSRLAAVNGVVGTPTGSGTEFSIPVMPNAPGPVSLSAATAAAIDAAGNPGAATQSGAIVYAPALSLHAPARVVALAGRPVSVAIAARSGDARIAPTISTPTDLSGTGLSLQAAAGGRATLIGTAAGNAGSFSVVVRADDGQTTAEATIACIVVPAETAPVAPEPVPATPADAPARFGIVGLATPEGVASVRAAFAAPDPTRARAFAFDASIQRYVELPGEPASGLGPESAVFLAQRVVLPLDLRGTPQGLPFAMTLRPGWNLLGVPPVHDGNSVSTSRPWSDFALETADGAPIADAIAILGTPGGSAASARPWNWDGAQYVQVDTLASGAGYWFKNNGDVPVRLVIGGAAVAPVPAALALARMSAGGRIVDRGTPPAPPAAAPGSSSGGSGGGGCGGGSGIGLVGLVGLLIALRSRRMR